MLECSRLGAQRSPWVESVMRGIVGLELQGTQPPAAHGRAQALAAHPAPFLA